MGRNRGSRINAAEHLLVRSFSQEFKREAASLVLDLIQDAEVVLEEVDRLRPIA